MAGAVVPDVEKLLALAVEGVGGEPRTGQLAMVKAAQHAMASGEHLLVQAGTGTGKSLAYLVPAIRHALVDGVLPEKPADADEPPQARGPVVVATATIALQRQLVERDLPRLVESLAPVLPHPPTFAILKGRRNYLCLQRFHAGPDDEQDALFDGADRGRPLNTGPTSALGRDIVRIGEWANRPTPATAMSCCQA